MAIVDILNNFIKPPDNRKEGGDDAISDGYKNTRRLIKYVQWMANPAVLIPIIIIIFLIIMFPVFFSPSTGSALNGSNKPPEPDTVPGSGGGSSVPAIQGFSVLLTGPVEINNGATLKYKVTITYDPDVATVPLESIELYDVMPSGVSFGRTNGVLKDPSANPHVWSLSEDANKNGFDIELNPEVTDTIVIYTVNARAVGGVGGGGGAPPTTDNCNGKYDLTQWPAKNPLNANYGDPSCNFTRNDLFALIKSLDPTYADVWYQMASCETGGTYISNSYNGNSTSGSAWGLFQMGHEAYPNLGISRQMNNQYDRGDVEWSIQTSNAINYNKLRGNDFKYWGCSPFN